MSARNVKTTTSQQFELLISEIEKNPELAQRTTKLNPNLSRQKWEEITRKLNSKGPPERQPQEWKKVYFDLRLRVRKKYDDNRSGKFAELFFTKVEKSLLRALKLNEAAAQKLKSINRTTFSESPTTTRSANKASPESSMTVTIKHETNSANSSAAPSPTPFSPASRESMLESPPLIYGYPPPASDHPTTSSHHKTEFSHQPTNERHVPPEPPEPPTNDDNVSNKRKKPSSEIPGNRLFRRQIQNQVEYLDISRDIVEMMSGQRACLEELSKTAQIHAKLMEQQVILLEKQTVAMERQAAALERMANL